MRRKTRRTTKTTMKKDRITHTLSMELHEVLQQQLGSKIYRLDLQALSSVIAVYESLERALEKQALKFKR